MKQYPFVLMYLRCKFIEKMFKSGNPELKKSMKRKKREKREKGMGSGKERGEGSAVKTGQGSEVAKKKRETKRVGLGQRWRSVT